MMTAVSHTRTAEPQESLKSWLFFFFSLQSKGTGKGTDTLVRGKDSALKEPGVVGAKLKQKKPLGMIGSHPPYFPSVLPTHTFMFVFIS